MHATACQASSNLERFIAGTYDPVTDAKKRDDGAKQDRGDGEGRGTQGGQFNDKQQAPGQEARRRALSSFSHQLFVHLHSPFSGQTEGCACKH